LFFTLIAFMSRAEPEAELLGIREAADAIAEYVHARGVNREERLLDLPYRARDMVDVTLQVFSP
jgi:hypothetical protein